MPRHPHVSPTIAAMGGSVYSNLAHRLAAHTGPTYPLHIGDTWREPPAECQMEALRTADNPGLHRYASVHGLPALLDAIVARERATTMLPVAPDEVLVTAGATGGLGAVAGALLAPGDEVLLLAPYWPLIAGIVRTMGGTPVPVPVFDGPVDAATVRAVVEGALTHRTVAIYANTPNNPTGRLLPTATLEALVDVARAQDLWLWTDEVYAHYAYAAPHTFGRPLAPERTFAAHSFSKAYGMAGNRCGYVVGPSDVMEHLRKVSTHTFYSTPTAAQVAAARALDGPGDAWAAEAAAGYAEVGAEAARRLGLPAPEGSTFLFFDVADALDDAGLAGLLEACVDRGLLLAPGPSFGPFPTHVRLCFTAAPPEVVLDGVDILAEVLRGCR